MCLCGVAMYVNRKLFKVKQVQDVIYNKVITVDDSQQHIASNHVPIYGNYYSAVFQQLLIKSHEDVCSG